VKKRFSAADCSTKILLPDQFSMTAQRTPQGQQ
jgi:hypothetical protein